MPKAKRFKVPEADREAGVGCEHCGSPLREYAFMTTEADGTQRMFCSTTCKMWHYGQGN